MPVFAEQAFRQHMLNSTNVSAIIGARLSNWVSPESDILPYGTFYRIDAEHVKSFNNGSNFAKVRLQADWFSDSLSEVIDLADKARQQMDGFAGTVSVASTSLDIKGLLVSEQQQPFMPDNDSDSPVFRVSQDYIVSHAETAAN